MKALSILRITCAAALLGVANASGAVVASYPFTGSSLASTDTDPGTVTTNVVLGTGLTDSSRFTTAGNPGAALTVNTDETSGTSFATATTAGDDFGFRITPGSGTYLALSSFTFDLGVAAGTDSSVRVQVGTDGTTFVTLATISDYTATAFTTETVPLTGVNNVLASGLPLYVRFVVFDAESSGSLYTAFDNITVNGTTSAVPEPGTSALLMLGFGGLAGGLALRRRRLAA